MCSAVDFLPSSITLLMTCWTSLERWTGSGSIVRIVAAARRGITSAFDAVLRAGLLAVRDAGGVERAADDLVAHARQVLDAAAAHEHDGVLLQVVALARDVDRDLHAVGQAHAGHLAQGRVRLLGRGGVDARAHPATLRRGHLLLAALAGLQARGGELLRLRVAALADQLGRRRHTARDGSSGALSDPLAELPQEVDLLLAALVELGFEALDLRPAAAHELELARRCGPCPRADPPPPAGSAVSCHSRRRRARASSPHSSRSSSSERPSSDFSRSASRRRVDVGLAVGAVRARPRARRPPSSPISS